MKKRMRNEKRKVLVLNKETLGTMVVAGRDASSSCCTACNCKPH